MVPINFGSPVEVTASAACMIDITLLTLFVCIAIYDQVLDDASGPLLDNRRSVNSRL